MSTVPMKHRDVSPCRKTRLYEDSSTEFKSNKETAASDLSASAILSARCSKFHQRRRYVWHPFHRPTPFDLNGFVAATAASRPAHGAGLGVVGFAREPPLPRAARLVADYIVQMLPAEKSGSLYGLAYATFCSLYSCLPSWCSA